MGTTGAEDTRARVNGSTGTEEGEEEARGAAGGEHSKGPDPWQPERTQEEWRVETGEGEAISGETAPDKLMGGSG